MLALRNPEWTCPLCNREQNQELCLGKYRPWAHSLKAKPGTECITLIAQLAGLNGKQGTGKKDGLKIS